MLLDILKEEPDNRTITFIIDSVGGAGKTQIATYIE